MLTAPWITALIVIVVMAILVNNLVLSNPIEDNDTGDEGDTIKEAESYLAENLSPRGLNERKTIKGCTIS